MIKRLILVSLLTFPSLSHGQVSFLFRSQKSGHQDAKKNIVYGGGTLTLAVSDGSWELAACGHPSATRIFPSLGCTLGTTGYLAIGDLDGDDIRDDGSFWSLASAPTGSVIVAPFQAVGMRVESAPPSAFIRPGILPVNDGSIVIWYNVLDALNQDQYDIAAYTYFQDFDATPAGRSLHDRTVVEGSYIFSVPWIADTNQRQTIAMNKIAMPESYPGLVQSPINSGFRFTNDDRWNGAGALEFDPRLFNDITWYGNLLGQNVLASVDTLRLWMLATPSASPFDMPSTEIDPNVVFPPAAGAILLDNPGITSYRLPGLFFDPGDTARMYLRMDRTYPTGIANDISTRVWSVDLAFIDTYTGFSLLNGAFPAGTSAAERSANYDFDDDGESNLIEFALPIDPLLWAVPGVWEGSDPTDISSVPGALSLDVKLAGNSEVTILKRPFVGTSIKYEIEYSPNPGPDGPWTKVKAGDPDWSIDIDDATQLVVSSNAPLAAAVFVRAAITQVK